MTSRGAAARTKRRGSVTPARRAAQQICDALEAGGHLDIAWDRAVAQLDNRDRRWLRQLLYGTLRQRLVLDARLEGCVSGGLSRISAQLLDLLRLGCYQLLFMGSVPAYAAIGETVELAKELQGVGAGKLVNAVLRRIDRERDSWVAASYGDPVEQLAALYSHPRWLVERWMARFGEAETTRLLDYNNREASIHVRPYGVEADVLATELRAAGATVSPSPLLQSSLQLLEFSGLTEFDAFDDGRFFVQDPGASLVTAYAAIPARVVVADLCSAPGGKTLELSRDAALVLAADASFERIGRLRSNVARMRATNVEILVGDARSPALGYVDAVLLDAPCTGTGTFNRHPDARWRIKASDIAVMAALQKRMLDAAASLVKPGGLLIYSTCSLEEEENVSQVERFLSDATEWSLVPPPEGSVPATVMQNGMLHVLPQLHGADGSFAARLRRSA